MTNEQFEQWIKALLSGQYAKGEYQLKSRNNEYCCLGVANEIFNLGYDMDNDFLAKCNNITGDPEEFGFIEEELQEQIANINDNNLTFIPVVDYLLMIKQELVE